MTKLSSMRDRSVVRSSVMPSARYSCEASSLRLAKGSTTIDRRGAVMALLAGPAAALDPSTAGGTERGAGRYQSAAAPTAISTAAADASTNARRRDECAGATGADAVGM